MKLLNFGRRRKLLRMKRWFARRFDPKEIDMSAEQDKAYRIAKKLITDSNSVLYADISKERLIIVNGLRYIRITSSKIRIIDGPYKYDISYDPRRLEELTRIFANNLEHRHDKIEHEIGQRVERSLDHILKDLYKNENENPNDNDNKFREKSNQEQKKALN